jgi:hypothetical protein
MLLLYAVLAIPIAAQIPTVRIDNLSRPDKKDFQVGDRFRITINGPANQPISVRTMMQGRTDWGPVIGKTDETGMWFVSGQFEKADFGSWTEVWTVGGKAANPVISFAVDGSCMPGGREMIFASGPNTFLNCDISGNGQTFSTPSQSDPMKTPDGRVIPGHTRSNMTQQDYQMEIMQWMIATRDDAQPGVIAAKAGDLIVKMIGVNALTEAETKKVLSIVRAAYQPSPFRAQEMEKPAILALLEHLANQAEQENLKKEILDTANFVRAQ